MATAELLGKPHLVRQSVVLAVEQMMNVKLREFEIAVHAIDREDIRVETDIPERLKLDLPTAHKIIERALLGVAGLVHRFAEMEAYSAISGFIEEDLPLVSEQLDFLAKSISPAAKEQQFRRVVTMAGFPDFSAASDQRKVNMARLLEIRETNECREFREWLPSIAAASDKEIRERIESLRSRLGNLVSTAGGKTVRLLATTGIGCIPVVGPMAGLVAGAIDTFLLEKLLPKSGPVAFLSRLYPSVFDQRET
jgi:hypothetical protein